MRERLASVAEDLGRLETSIADLLDTSRLEAGQWTPRAETWEAGEIIADVVSRLPAADRQRIAFDVPEPGPTVHVDFAQLSRALTNLVDNALLYGPRGQPVTVGARREGERTLVWVEDHGPGVSQRPTHPHVFEKFYRGAEGRARTGSTGLGLSIASEIVHANDGTLTLEDVQPTGARFVISLPAEAGGADRHASRTKEPDALSPDETHRARGGRRAADPEGARLDPGRRATSASSPPRTARAALEATLETTPDLIVLDLTLPDIDGLALLPQLRSYLDVPVLVLSARTDERDKIEALNTGADDYLTKPFSAGELVARVNALLRRSAGGGEGATAVVEVGDLVDRPCRTGASRAAARTSSSRPPSTASSRTWRRTPTASSRGTSSSSTCGAPTTWATPRRCAST